METQGSAWQTVGYDRTFRRDVSRGVWVQVVPDAWQVALSDVWRRFPKRGARWRVMIDLQESLSVRRRYGLDTYNVTYSNAREAMAAAPEVYRAAVLAESLEPIAH